MKTRGFRPTLLQQEQARARNRKFRASAKGRAAYAARQAAPEEKRRLKNLRYLKAFGITLDDYEEAFAALDGCCWICEFPESEKDANGNVKRLAVDHDHITGEIRGLLCGRCNRGIGSFSDRISILEKAIKYLRRWKT